jgi:hypothetical protein
MGGAVGNRELHARVTAGNATRDELLGFLTGRLGTIRTVQEREGEQASYRNLREHWKEISEPGHAGITEPDATRWHQAARLYSEAAQHLCNGNVIQGRADIERALEAERQAFSGLTQLVQVNDIDQTPERATALDDTARPAERRSVPIEVEELVRKILADRTNPPDQPYKRKTRTPWWTEDEEEEDEDGDGDGAG